MMGGRRGQSEAGAGWRGPMGLGGGTTRWCCEGPGSPLPSAGSGSGTVLGCEGPVRPVERARSLSGGGSAAHSQGVGRPPRGGRLWGKKLKTRRWTQTRPQSSVQCKGLAWSLRACFVGDGATRTTTSLS